jgi:hypothetical protein
MAHNVVPGTNPEDQASSPTAGEISPEYHKIQLRYKLASTTIKDLVTIKAKPDRHAVLQKACFATEFRSFPIKPAEGGFFRDINDHNPIPYPVRETVSQPWHKVFLLIQVDLQRSGWPNKLSATARKELLQESGKIYSVLDRVLRCIVDILGQRLDGRGVTVGLDVLRSVKSRVWEGSVKELLQVEGIGEVKMKKLMEASISNIRQLALLECYHIERLLSRNPPFGTEMLHRLAGFPVLTFKLDILSELENRIESFNGSDASGTNDTAMTA